MLREAILTAFVIVDVAKTIRDKRRKHRASKSHLVVLEHALCQQILMMSPVLCMLSQCFLCGLHCRTGTAGVLAAAYTAAAVRCSTAGSDQTPEVLSTAAQGRCAVPCSACMRADSGAAGCASCLSPVRRPFMPEYGFHTLCLPIHLSKERPCRASDAQWLHAEVYQLHVGPQSHRRRQQRCLWSARYRGNQHIV